MDVVTGENKEHREKNNSVMSIVQFYAQEATVHCVKYLANGDLSVKHRLFWAVMILAAISGLVGTIIFQLKALLSYPAQIKQETKIGSHLPFPAVTICNNNYLRKSQVIKYPDLEGFLMNRLVVKADRSSSSAKWSDSVNNVFGHMNETEAEFLRNTAHTLDMTFKECFWENKERNCSELFTRTVTDSGVCHSFNSMANGRRKPYVSMTTGFNNGLYLLLNVNQQEYTPTLRSNSAGFRVILHDFKQTPLQNNGFTVGPGFTNEVKIKMKEITYLPAPYKAYANTTCKDPAEARLKYFPEYDIGACFWECKIDYIIEKCGCKNIYEPASVPVPYCNVSQIAHCSDRHVDEFWSSVAVTTCPCFPTCSQRIFDTSLSLSYFPSDAFAEYQRILGSDNHTDWYRKNFLELKLFYGDYIYEKMTQEPIYTFESISATLGGQMGLYLGISLLSVIELGHMIITCLWVAVGRLFGSRLKTKACPMNDIARYHVSSPKLGN